MSKKKPPALSLSGGGSAPTDSPDGGGGTLIAVDTTSVEIERCRKSMQEMHLTSEQEAHMKAFLDEKQKITEQGEMKEQHFVRLAELGFGNGGVVLKVEHKPTGIVIARKMIMLDIKPAVRNQIMRELKVLHECASPHIVGFYGNFCLNNEISVCMQHMDGGSLDLVMKAGRIPVDMIGKITISVVEGLHYLRKKHNIIHRDVKPSNILVNTRGEIKLCDFGVSGQLIDSLANSFVGTRSYMAPERLQGSEYSVLSDIWSLGISLAEMALGRYPIPQPTPNEIEDTMKITPAGTLPPAPGGNPYASHAHAMRMPIFELLQIITTSDPPTLPSQHFSEDFRALVELCLQKEHKKRGNLEKLKDSEFLKACKVTSSEFADWVKRTVEANTILEKEEAQ